MLLPHSASQPSFTDTHSGKTPYCARRGDRGRLPEENTEVKDIRATYSSNSPLVAQDRGRAALWRQISVISAVYFGYRYPEERGWPVQ